LELSYLRQDANSPTSYRDNGLFNGEIQFTDFDQVIDWIMLNRTRCFPVNDQIEPFGSAGIGMGIFSLTNPDTNRSGSTTKLAWNFRGGTNIGFSENVGIKLQASFFSVVQSIRGSLYFGSGGGLITYSSMFQFSFDGGIVISLPN
jgi:opacity protein-like surface antigen